MKKSKKYPACWLKLYFYYIILLVGFILAFIFLMFKPYYKATINGEFIGYYKNYEEFEEYYEDRTVPIHEFNDILDHNRIDSMHYLKTYTFIKDNQIWNLLLIDGQYFLEVETTIQHPDVILPKELCDAIPITNSTYYDLISELGYKRTLLK